jgi:glycosyltransferase involved in cell wall biosynthesis
MTVSVCMATFNGEKYIVQQVESIIRQLSEFDELIIVDDCSTDKTVELLRRINDPRIKIFINSTNMGVVYSFNRSLENSSGDILFLSDQDDIWLDGKVSSCVEELFHCHLVVTDCSVVNQNLDTLHESFFSLSASGPGVLKNIYKNTYLGCCMAFRRSLLNLILPIPMSLMENHDTWIGFLSGTCFKNKFLSEQLLLYRRHSDNASPTSGVSNNNIIFKIASRLQLLSFGTFRLVKYYLFNKK